MARHSTDKPHAFGWRVSPDPAREALLVPARELEIDAFGVPRFAVRALAIDEVIAETWRCLVQTGSTRC